MENCTALYFMLMILKISLIENGKRAHLWFTSIVSIISIIHVFHIILLKDMIKRES